MVPSPILVSATLLSIVFGLQYPSNVPRIREKPGAGHFSLRTRLAYYIDCEALFREAYEKLTTLTARPSSAGPTKSMASLGGLF
ncbi:hypothetical protein HYQ46_013062 [Verticillium longisporum]|nr:hypothetical protein HYQ46_013062 [Verticillium longisporum]